VQIRCAGFGDRQGSRTVDQPPARLPCFRHGARLCPRRSSDPQRAGGRDNGVGGPGPECLCRGRLGRTQAAGAGRRARYRVNPSARVDPRRPLFASPLSPQQLRRRDSRSRDCPTKSRSHGAVRLGGRRGRWFVKREAAFSSHLTLALSRVAIADIAALRATRDALLPTH
jgi:hypothetical protein